MPTTTRTTAEILDRIKQIEDQDFFGTETNDLASRLSFDEIRPLLKDDAKVEDWAVDTQAPRDLIVDYLPFAWDKANNQRGLSANRSISHMRAWLWLDGYSEAADSLMDMYEAYGKPCLVMIGEMYGFDWRKEDDGEWSGMDEVGREKAIDRATNKARECVVAHQGQGMVSE